MQKVKTFKFAAEGALVGERLDRAITSYLQRNHADLALTRSQVERLISDGQVSVSGRKVVKSGARLEKDSKVELLIPPPSPMLLEPDPSVEFGILYEDEDLLVVNKPAGLVVHPGAGNKSGTLVHGLLAYLGDSIRQTGSALRPGIVHRLDKDTTGALVVAKNQQAFSHLVKQFLPPRSMHRTYLAVALKLPHGSEGVIDLAVGRSSTDRKKMAAHSVRGKEAITRWRVVERFDIGGLLQLELETGRTHQIRVHLQALGSPIVGDPLYSRGQNVHSLALRKIVEGFPRQALHAWKLSFLHPRTAELREFEAPLPADFQQLLAALRGTDD